MRNTWIDCQDGQPSTGQLTIGYAAADGILHVSGQVKPCRQPRGTDIYTIATYQPHDATAAQSADAGGATAWYADYSDDEYSTFTTRIQVDPNAQAICLVTGANARAQCYEVSTTTSGDGRPGTPTVATAIPTTDPRVQRGVPCPPPRLSGPPSCRSCW